MTRRRNGTGLASVLLPLTMAILSLQDASAWAPAPRAVRSSLRTKTTRLSSSRTRRHRPMNMAAVNNDSRRGVVAHGSRILVGSAFVRSTGLFPQREARSSSGALSMVTDGNASGNEAGDGNQSPLVKVWLSFRKLLAQLWAILTKPFQLMKSLLDKADKDGDSLAAGSDEPIQEEVAITMVENIAAAEKDEKETVEVSTEEAIPEDVTAAATSEEELEPTNAGPAATDVMVESTPVNQSLQAGRPRQATASASVDLTGNWTLIVDDSFTSQYDDYLRKLGQPMLVRTVALGVIGSTKEETAQKDGGQQLYIQGTNVRGSWERTLETSERVVDGASDGETHAVDGHVLKPMTTADGEDVEVASWWENSGRVHHSWVIGGEKYGGGDFENKRYLTDDGNILVCESTFHPKEEGREKACVKWRFLREGAMYGDSPLQLPNIFDVFKKEEKESDDKDTESKVIVGDIMDDVSSSGEAGFDLSSTLDDRSVPSINMDMIEEAIERENWVPPAGDRWAICAPGVDLSGKWKLIINEDFKKKYDDFLRSLGQPSIVRGVAVVLVGNTREETEQTDGGRNLFIKGVNAKGIWERTLSASGSDFDETVMPNVDGTYDHARVPILTADSERVDAESWWESDGTVHVSWTYGVEKYGGGCFESRRYLESGGNVYVCESTFHPNGADREKSYLKWKFLREGSAFMQ